MTLTVHRPARLLSSLQGDDPAALDVSLPGLPLGTTLDPEVLDGAACGEHDLELFYPEPGDTAAEHAAKQVCATCPVRRPCLDMALATGDQHAILGGTTPARTRPPAPPAPGDPRPPAGRSAGHRRHRHRPGPPTGTGGAKHGRPPAGRR